MKLKYNQDNIDGIVVGVIMFIKDGAPYVVFPGNSRDCAILARTTVGLAASDVGAEVALSFEGGDPSAPIILGRLLRPQAATEKINISEELEITADTELTLRCGKASITLTRSGKIILRGTYISSRSSGAIRIKGGSVQIN